MPVQPPSGGPRAPGASQDPRVRAEDERRVRRRSEQLADSCQELEESLEQLRARYDLFFLGVERREPVRDREEMRRAVARIKAEANLPTGLRFRIETLHARFLSYDRMWVRVARQKEEGTYRRDIHRLRRRQARAAEAERTADAGGEPKEAPAVAGPASPSPPERAPAPAATPAPTSAPGAALSPEQMQALYAAYVEAKRRCNEDVSRVTYDALARTVTRQIPELLARYQARSVEFKVVIKDGRALLKAVPRS